ncbi:MAG: hypothetical protein AAF490_15945 [Chloroflexota bacterium]
MDLRERLREILASDVWNMLIRVKETAVSLNMPVYLIGGPVRDLLLNVLPTDLDIIIEGDAIQVAQKMAKQYGGNLTVHHPFGTAVWHFESIAQEVNQKSGPSTFIHAFDFVTTRKESYAHPAALPTVVPSHLLDDLKRRDFPINAMGIRLDGDAWGELIDPLGGWQDMQASVVRVLHDKSFIDDPTRIFRAVRYAMRLQYDIEPHTVTLLQEALPVLNQTTGVRLWHEFERIFQEPFPEQIMSRLQTLGVLAKVAPGLRWQENTAVLFKRARDSHASVFIYFALWLLSLSQKVETAVFERFAVPVKVQQELKLIRRCLQAIQALPDDAKPSQVVPNLRPLTSNGLIVLQTILDQPIQKTWLSKYQNEWQHISPTVNGDVLIAKGLKPSAQFKKILDLIDAAWLDGEIVDTASENAYLDQIITQYLS